MDFITNLRRHRPASVEIVNRSSLSPLTQGTGKPDRVAQHLWHASGKVKRKVRREEM